MSPMKPVNLLPDVPIHNNARKLTDKEQRDCDVIGECLVVERASWTIPSTLNSLLTICIRIFHRAPDQVVLLHRAQIDPGLGAEGHHALPGQLRQGQSTVGAGDAPVQIGQGRGAAERVRSHCDSTA